MTRKQSPEGEGPGGESLPVTMAPTWGWFGLRTELQGLSYEGKGPDQSVPAWFGIW